MINFSSQITIFSCNRVPKRSADLLSHIYPLLGFFFFGSPAMTAWRDLSKKKKEVHTGRYRS